MPGSPARDPLAVAGIPFEHHTPLGVDPPLRITAEWPGTPVSGEPLRVVHRVGSTSPAELKPLLESPAPLGEYYLDRQGEIAVRTNAREIPGERPQLLRTLRRGYEYALHVEEAHDSTRLLWGWHRTLFMLALPLRARGLIAHATGFVLPGEAAVLAPGASGVGKSTLATLLLQHAGEQVRVVGDDRIALTIESDGVRMWGTPWHSSARAVAARDAPLAAMVFVTHGPGAALVPLARGVALRRLLRAVGIPFWDRSAAAFALEVIDRMISGSQCFEFTYAPKPAAANVLVDGLMAAVRSGSF